MLFNFLKWLYSFDLTHSRPLRPAETDKKLCLFFGAKKNCFRDFVTFNKFHNPMTVKVKLVVKKIQILIPFMLFTKLSTAMTLKSSCNNCKIQWLPIYPPPPVTKMFLPVPGIMLYWNCKQKNDKIKIWFLNFLWGF